MTATAQTPTASRQRVLVAEKVGASGIDLLKEHFDVEIGFDWDRDKLAERLGEFDGILIRSATKLDAELLSAGGRLRAVGRAGVGVDNVDVEIATKRGIVVANAPQSNVITAAEHTMALLLALARNVPQAHASLTSGKWERSKFSGIELYEKTLGILGFGRIGQLVAQRAKGVRDADRRLRPLRFRRPLSGPRGREGRLAGRRLRRRRLPDAAPAEDSRDRRLAERRGAREVQGRRPRPQRRARAAGRRRGPEGGDRQRQGRGCGARRVPGRADHRAPAVRLSQRDRDSAPRRLDGRGHRPGRLPGGRADRRGADGRLGHHRRQHPGDSARGPRGARPVRAVVPRAGTDRGRARGLVVDRSRADGVPRPDRRSRHEVAGDPGADRGAQRSHRGGDQRGQRADARRRARDRVGRDQAEPRA